MKLVVASLLLLHDKEPSVPGLIARKLAECGVDPGTFQKEDGGLDNVTFADALSQPGFGSSPASSASGAPLLPDSSTSPALSTGEDGHADAANMAAAAVRMAARKAAGAAAQLASAAARQAEAIKRAGQGTRPLAKKRGSAMDTHAKHKRARHGGAASDTDSITMVPELDIPSIEPSSNVTSCTVIEEAAMLADHTYLSLATNWQPPVVNISGPKIVVEMFSESQWPTIVNKQGGLDIMLTDVNVRDARKELMQKVQSLRSSNEVDPNEEGRVCVKVTSDGRDDVQLTLATLQAMGELHTAADRLQDFRCAVAWEKDAAVNPNSRVPSYVSEERSSMGKLGTVIVRRLLSCSPTATVWRMGTPRTGGTDEDVVLVKNIGDVWMYDDGITINSLILQRWCDSTSAGVRILQCSVFTRLLTCTAENIDALVEEVSGFAGAATTLAGVCNINGAHWVGFAIDLSTKTVTLYDSGAHFLSLKAGVDSALKRVHALGKGLLELREMREDQPGNTSRPPVEGEEEDEGTKTTPAVRALEACVKKANVWSTLRVRVPKQDDTHSCGPFALLLCGTWRMTRSS